MRIKQSYKPLDVQAVRPASILTIVSFLLADWAGLILITLFVFKTHLLESVAQATHGLVNATLIANLIMILLIVYFLLHKGGRLSFKDLGLKKGRMTAAILATLGLWLILQLVNLIFGLIAEGKPMMDAAWGKYEFTVMLGLVISQLFGNCLFEEITYRGFLLPQVMKKLKGKRAMLWGILISQGLFALMHIPNRILNGIDDIASMAINLGIVLSLGLLFAFAYWVTDNLFFVMGVHTLVNAPMMVFDGLPSIWLVVVLTLIILAVWPKTFGKLHPVAANDAGKISA